MPKAIEILLLILVPLLWGVGVDLLIQCLSRRWASLHRVKDVVSPVDDQGERRS